jgi:aldehyde:ferredoxin oxidoreductase
MKGCSEGGILYSKERGKCIVAGGFYGSALKKAGVDHVVIQGMADEPVYLWIDDDNVQLMDAKQFVGQVAV